MSAELLTLLFEGLCASTAAIVLVLLLRRPWRAGFGAGSGPLLWAIVPLALLAVLLPAPVQVLPAQAFVAEAASIAPSLPASPAAIDYAHVRTLGLLLWAAGSIISAVFFVLQQRRFRRDLGALRDAGDGVRFASSTALGPAVIGLLRPRIVLPADFHDRYTPDQQALILTHERSHLQRGDLFANALATALRAIYWFNPLVHHAAGRMRHDHELASDAAVLRQHPHARRRYADALLNTQLAVPGLPVGCMWQSSHPLKERIMMIQHPVPQRWRRLAGSALGLSLSIGVACAAWAAQPARIQLAAGAVAGTATSNTTATHEVKFSIVADGEQANPVLRFAEGESFGIAVGIWEADFEYSRESATKGKISAKLRKNGVEVSRPLLVFNNDRPFAIENIMDGASFRLEGVVTPITTAVNTVASEDTSYRQLSPPRYPAAALRRGESGMVVVRVKVDTDGTPIDVHVHSATLPGVFEEASLEAVRSWKFNPAHASGAPIVGEVLVPICFALDGVKMDCRAPESALDVIETRGSK